MRARVKTKAQRKEPKRRPKHNEYRVVWEVDVTAASPRQAAVQARALQLDPTNIATIYDVYDIEKCPDLDRNLSGDSGKVLVDLRTFTRTTRTGFKNAF